VSKGEEMTSTESSLTDEEEVGERPHSDGDLHKIVSCVNEDDEKSQTSVTEKENQKTLLIIGGVEIFLPSSRGKARKDVADVRTRFSSPYAILKRVPYSISLCRVTFPD
jgi:hypothetical protein